MFLLYAERERPLLFFTYRRKVHAGNVVPLVNLRSSLLCNLGRFAFSFLFLFGRVTPRCPACASGRPTYTHTHPAVVYVVLL